MFVPAKSKKAPGVGSPAISAGPYIIVTSLPVESAIDCGNSVFHCAV